MLLTHRLTPRVLRHFERLRTELAELFPVFLCFHEPTEALAGAPSACPDGVDIHLTSRDGAKWLPRRHLQYRESSRGYNSGFMDLVLVPLVMDERLAGFDHVWIVEFDVDFAGHWSEFFGWAARSHADFLSPVVARRPDDEPWPNWKSVRTPEPVGRQEHLRGFFPLLRIARRVAVAYVEELERRNWEGRHEALMPTIAALHGLSVASMTPNKRFDDSRLGNGVSRPNGTTLLHRDAFVYRPILGSQYFHENPDAFPITHSLYHPIKPGDPKFFDAVFADGPFQQ